jgi:hypothetical protein
MFIFSSKGVSKTSKDTISFIWPIPSRKTIIEGPHPAYGMVLTGPDASPKSFIIRNRLLFNITRPNAILQTGTCKSRSNNTIDMIWKYDDHPVNDSEAQST